MFEYVDLNKSGSLDFSEYLYLLFMWAEVGEYEQILQTSANGQLVHKAFTQLQENFSKFDYDKNNTFSFTEFQSFMEQKLSKTWHYSTPTINRCFSPEEREHGLEIGFNRFVFILYSCTHDMKDNLVQSRYVESGVIKSTIVGRSADGAAAAPDSALQFLREAFQVLETDFKHFDKDGNGYIEYKELTSDVPSTPQTVDILARLQASFDLVDLDRSKSTLLHYCSIILL